jgi:hypothetical protein
MDFLRGFTNLTNWLGNVIMPTLGALFFIVAILRYGKGYAHGYIPYAGFACLMVSGLLRALETFSRQAAWDNPDLPWIVLRGLVDWTGNVFMPVYAVLQIAQGGMAFAGLGHRIYAGAPWMRHFAAAALALSVSGLVRLAEFFIQQGTGGVS